MASSARYPWRGKRRGAKRHRRVVKRFLKIVHSFVIRTCSWLPYVREVALRRERHLDLWRTRP